MHPTGSNNVLDGTDESVPVHKVRHVGRCQRLITKGLVRSLAIEKYRTNGKGITFEDLIIKFSIKKGQAQRSLNTFIQLVSFLPHKTLFPKVYTCFKIRILRSIMPHVLRVK
jgi:hypothetical protein